MSENLPDVVTRLVRAAVEYDETRSTPQRSMTNLATASLELHAAVLAYKAAQPEGDGDG
jgi:hypothetical protein